ncbi:DUF2293 domain-containing protein [Pseudovibrio flavus]|uniref:DUF2293 domain-containing protein n=1 Tax=Pseudovibrio flavus TaxID=2529854 RepID=UPI003528C402
MANHLLGSTPKFDRQEIEAKAAASHLRHIGEAAAIKLAAASYIRHCYTSYDDLLHEGYDRDSARFYTLSAINEQLTQWNCKFRVSAEENMLGGATSGRPR